jgi:hypothetical protein
MNKSMQQKNKQGSKPRKHITREEGQLICVIQAIL